MIDRRRLRRLFIGLTACTLTMCDLHPPYWRNANMSPTSPRVQAVLANLQPHCFGRFLIDLPSGSRTAWGNSRGFIVSPGRAAELDGFVKGTEDDRKSEMRYPRGQNLHLYFETRKGPLPGMRHIVSQNDFDSENYLRINTYFTIGDALVGRQSYARGQELDETITEIEEEARRLRHRPDDEIPTDPGQCIENGFIADRPNADKEEVRDFLSVGFRLKDPADVHLSIAIEAATNEQAKPRLGDRLDETDTRAHAHGQLSPLGKLTTFRRARRDVPAWPDGFEFLSKTPDQEYSYAHHDFWMIFTGEPDTLYRPYVDIRMASGVSANKSGKARTTLTDEDAIAIWDALTSTLRVRPTTAKKAEAVPETPLGTLAATGRACPRTGLWQCADESSPVQGGRRQWFRIGETMPSAVLLGETSMWQRLKGETPSHSSPTVWKLVSLEPPQTSGRD